MILFRRWSFPKVADSPRTFFAQNHPSQNETILVISRPDHGFVAVLDHGLSRYVLRCIRTGKLYFGDGQGILDGVLVPWC